jgi:glycosyltransferase involved in cell wall biosynthesis
MAILTTSLSPGISIIIVSFNESARLQATLSSIPQYFQNVEVILVAPASDEIAIRIANSPEFKQVRVIHDRGLGVYQAMNFGILNANFSHILFLNTGDLITNGHHLNDCLSVINRNVSTSLILPVEANWSDEIEKSNPDLFLFLAGSSDSYVSHQGVLFSRLFVSREGYFDQKYKVAADFKQLCLLYRNGDYEVKNIKLVSIEFPKFSSQFNRRGRVESLAISILSLRGRIRFIAFKSRLISETKLLLKKFSKA